MRKNKSVPKISNDYGQYRRKSQGQLRYVSQSKGEKYNPIIDPRMKIYLGGKKNIKTKLQQLGYIFNPQNTSIIGKHSMKTYKLPKIELKSTQLPGKNKKPVESITKKQFDDYLTQIKRKLKVS